MRIASVSYTHLAPQTQLMKTDIREKDGQYLLEIEVPGFTKDDVKAELKEGYLTITADRKEPVERADAVSYTHLDVYKRQALS